MSFEDASFTAIGVGLFFTVLGLAYSWGDITWVFVAIAVASFVTLVIKQKFF